MVFSSFTFLFRFLPFVLICYFLAPRKLKNLVLFLCSLIFYAWGEPVYIGLMLFSTVIDYINGIAVSYYKEKGNRRKAKLFLISSVCINLLLLFIFKYSNFILGASLPLPIGISFYTFQTMSYTIDVYRGVVKPQKSFIAFGTYVSLFPQLIAGPIVRYQTVERELMERSVTKEKFSYGVQRFVCGLGKKVLLANNIGVLWSYITAYPGEKLTIVMAWLGMIAFMFQIYFDFSGYSDMAIGLGAMFGFHFPENFMYPYQSKSITDFWRRWHMTLSSWFKEYVYIPLGGNRKGTKKQIRNIIIVWALTGLWHGANWNFLLWGLYFAVLLIIEKIWLKKWLQRFPDIIQHLYALFFIIIGWTIFAYPDMPSKMEYIKTMFGIGNHKLWNNEAIYLIYTYAILFLILIVASTDLPKKVVHRWIKKESFLCYAGKTVYILTIFLLSIAYLVNSSYNPFLYFRF